MNELIQSLDSPVLPELHLGEEVVGMHHALEHGPMVHNCELKSLFLQDLPPVLGLTCVVLVGLGLVELGDAVQFLFG